MIVVVYIAYFKRASKCSHALKRLCIKKFFHFLAKYNFDNYNKHFLLHYYGHQLTIFANLEFRSRE